MPPSVSLLLENAWFAAHELVLPAKLDPLSLPALERTKHFVAAIDADRPKPLRIDGVLPTFYDLRTRVSDETLDAIREKFTKILTPIRINAALAEPRTGKTIYELDPRREGRSTTRSSPRTSASPESPHRREINRRAKELRVRSAVVF